MLQNNKTLWYGENHSRKSYGQAGYVPNQIWENRRFWMVGLRKTIMQIQVRSLPQRSPNKNAKLAEFI